MREATGYNNIRYCYFDIIVLAHVTVMATKRQLNTDSSTVKKRRFCPHCSELVGYSTYYRHRDKYFDLQTQLWNKATIDIANEKDCTAECITESEDDRIVCKGKLHVYQLYDIARPLFSVFICGAEFIYYYGIGAQRIVQKAKACSKEKAKACSQDTLIIRTLLFQ